MDGVISGVDAAAIGLIAAGDTKGNEVFLGAAAVEAMIHLFSSAAGFEWADECDKAREERDAYMAGFRPEPSGNRFFAESPRPPQRSANSKGFYCSNSACVRDQDACERRRGPNDGPCHFQYWAFCYDYAGGHRSCLPSIPSCEEGRVQVEAPTECRERR